MENGETRRHLDAITDPGLFERLATAVLREADSRCRLLAHTGVNPEGKTVSSPVDGIAFVPGADPPHMIAVHHTTGRLQDLQRKWLHDPAGGSGKAGTSGPPGDMVKTAQIVDRQRRWMPDLQATLFLTTNKEPAERLVRRVNAAAAQAGLDVSIWSASALAHFLDFEAKGQWIRSQFLGIQQERLSGQLLHALSCRSLEQNPLPDDGELWVDCRLDRTLADAAGRDVTFVVAESGLGKSVACHKRLSAHIGMGGFGFVVPHDIIAAALSVEQAIDATLRSLHPHLAADQGKEALALASERTPLLMVVEDINRSEQPATLVERLTGWSSKQKEGYRSTRWRILCPVWPGILTTLADQPRKRVNEFILAASSFSVEDGAAAVRRRYEHAGMPMTELDAEAVSTALGHDPLLIALQDFATVPDAGLVIQTFIEGSLERLANDRGEFTAGEYRQGLRIFAVAMLQCNCLDPGMKDVAAWFSGDADNAVLLRHVAHFGEIMRVAGPVSEERLEFRHDRVRDWLLADAAADLMRCQAMPEAVLAEPYFAEIIGAALVRDGVPLTVVQQTGVANPLALFCAMRVFGEPTTDLHHAVLQAAITWLDDKTTHGPQHRNLRWTVRRILSECDASYVVSLIRRFRNERNDWWGLRARFRNGDFRAGMMLCCQVEPGVGAAGHLELINHVQQHRGLALVRTLDDCLRRSQLTAAGRTGALRLAGHLGDSTLADAIQVSWLADADRDDRLADYLWAAAQCCGSHTAGLLAPICERWAALPDEKKPQQPLSRSNLAAHHIRWAFQKRLPEPAVHLFIQRAASPELRWPITYMLHSIDHPDAVEFVARELAAKEAAGIFVPLTPSAGDEWRRRQEETGHGMSDVSRCRLQELWTDNRNGKHLRNRAFQLWCSTIAEGDIQILQAVTDDQVLGDVLLFQRLRRGDREALPGLVDKLNQDDTGNWWQAGRYIWSDELTVSIDRALGRRAGNVKRAWEDEVAASNDWHLSERLMELPTRTSEGLLIKHWDHLRFSFLYVQAAFYVGTTALVERAAQAVAESPNPRSMFRLVTSHFGIDFIGRTGITRIDQIKVLSPYFDYLEDGDLIRLWGTCNDHGWYEFRRQHLDTYVKSRRLNAYVDDVRATSELDGFLGQQLALWVGYWTEKFLETGVSVDHLMEVVQGWFTRQTDPRGLEVVADIVVQTGQRRHLDILSNLNAQATDQVNAIIVNASFALKRRSLN